MEQLLEILAAAGDDPADPVPVAIETPRGLMAAALRATGRPGYPINPMAVARYRERLSVSRTKSDHVDAMTLANILRTDAHVHRRIAADTDLAQAVAVLARAHQDAVWRRSKATNELRSTLREYYPGFLETVGSKSSTNLATAVARELLAIAPTPAAGAKLTKARIAAALRRAGRERGIEQSALRIRQGLQVPQLRHPELVEEAFGRQALALLALLDVECRNADALAEATSEAFRQHPDHEIITSFPGLSDSAGARVLAEIGDDRTRFVDARALKAYAGSAPVTRASGRSISITMRRIKNDRLAAAGWLWAFAAAAHKSQTRAHYLARREHGDRHQAALRNLFNRMLGQLYYCLQTGQPYDQVKAFPNQERPRAPIGDVAA